MKKLLIALFAFLILTACSSANTESIEGRWNLVSHGPATDQTPAAPDVNAFVEFGADGQLSGNVGCNGFGGEYEVEGNTITFGSMIATEMFCEGPVGEQERSTFSALSESATFVLDGDTLTITSEDGNSVIVLER